MLPAKLSGRPFCSYINEAIYTDNHEILKVALPVIRSICEQLNSREQPPDKFPSSNLTYRGVGMPDAHRRFFKANRIYRANMFSATSFSNATALKFARSNTAADRDATLFILNFDPVKKCKHVNYLESITDSTGEDEFLLVPYSGLKVKKDSWYCQEEKVWVIELDVLPDNKDIHLNLPSSPWH